MKSFVALLALVAVVAADVSHLNSAAQIVKQEADVFPDQYSFVFETSNGIKVQETGILKNVGKDNEGLEVQGSNSYVGQDGQVVSLSYVANENGYQPQGAHLPVPPAVPEYILRALEFIAAHPPKVEAKYSKSFVALLALVAVVAAAVSHLNSAAQIVKQEADVFPDQYSFVFETSNGIKVQESGILKNVGKENEGLEVQGSNSYVGLDGQVVSLSYVANENGYQPQGAHLPVPPAVPEYILRALEFIAAHPPKVEAKYSA